MLLGAAISWATGVGEVLPVTLGILSIGIILEALLVYSRKSVLLILWFFNLVLLSGFTYTIYWTYANYVDQVSAILLGGLVGITGLLTAGVSHFLAAKLVKGRRWVYLLFSFSLYYLSYIGTLVLLPDAGTIVPIIVSVLTPMIYLISAYLVKRRARKRTPIPEYVLPKNKNQTVLTGDLEKLLGMEPHSTEEGTSIFVNDKAVIIATPLSGEIDRNVTLSNDQLLVDDKDYAWTLEHTALLGRDFSKKHKVKQKKIIPMIVVNNINLPKTITPIKVRNRNNPDVTVGTVLIVKKNQLPAVVKQATTRLSEKELSKLA